MKQFICAILCVVALRAEFVNEIVLKKDETHTLNLVVENTIKILSFRWTLYKDNVLVTHFKYDNMPYQFTLDTKQRNVSKIELSSLSSQYSENPYMLFYFVDFNLATKEARFRYYLFRFNHNIEVI